MNTKFYSNGKLLLSAEYAVLDGALALAVPTKFGQSLEIEPSDSGTLEWKSLDENGAVWFNASFDVQNFEILSCSSRELAKTLGHVLMAVKKLNPNFNLNLQGYKITSRLTFPRNWGLGSSSTLINNLAQWGKVNPYRLLELTFGGSGYDIACAQHNSPILYQLKEDKPIVESISFNPSFKDQLYFVHLNQKQDSRKAIANYKKQEVDSTVLVEQLTNMTKRLIDAKNIGDFESLILKHEEVLSKVLKIRAIKEKMFPDYFGAIKSLGGWGGDFVLATGNEKKPGYFKAKGFDVVVPFKDMVL